MISFRRAIDLLLLPEVLLEALHPLEVRDDDPAGVGEHVGKNHDAAILEDLVGGRRRRAVRALDDELRLDPVGVLRRDHLLERAGREDVGVELEQLLVRDRVGVLQPFEAPPSPACGRAPAARRCRSGCGRRPPSPRRRPPSRRPPGRIGRGSSRRCRSPGRRRACPRVTCPASSHASRRQYSAPRAVASSRPSEPPTFSGLPVTTPSTEWPLFIE